MSAIAGMFNPDGQRVDREILGRMRAAIEPYGNDSCHSYCQQHVGMTRSLLRITPEDRFDRQPLASTESGLVFLFDGRIDNRREIAADLSIADSELSTVSDSSLAFRAWHRWGVDTVKKLVGDFALACIDTRERQLWLARDFLGSRPLFWCEHQGLIAFASLPRALFTIPGIDKNVDEERLHDFLCLLPYKGPNSFFKGISRVEPGHVVRFPNARAIPEAYYNFDNIPSVRYNKDEDYVEAFQHHLDVAVASQLRSDGPVASHLSSGLDSSTVTAVAANLLSREDRRLIAYTAAPRKGWSGDGPKWRHVDEVPGASAVATRFPNIEHVVFRTNRESPVARLKEHAERMEAAPLNPSNDVWWHGINRDAVDRGVKVMLTGGLGNASISYTGGAFRRSLLKKGRLLRFIREINNDRRDRPDAGWKALLLPYVVGYLPNGMWHRFLRRTYSDRGGFFDTSAINPAFSERMDTCSRAARAGWDMSYRPGNDGRRLRIGILTWADRGSHRLGGNALGLEERDPTVDRRLVEFCLGIPEEQYWNGAGRSKWLLKRAMKNLLPEEILADGRTRGFQAPDWYEGMLSDRSGLKAQIESLKKDPDAASFLDLDSMEALVDDCADQASIDWSDPAVEAKYRLKLLRGAAVGSFVRYVRGGND